MDGGWTQSGPNSDAVFDGVHEEVTLRARRRRSRVIPGDWLELVDSVSRKRALKLREVSDALSALLDLGWIEKVDEGFRVLVEKNLAEFHGVSGAAGRDRVSIAAKPRYLRGSSASGERSERSERSETTAATQKSAQNENGPKPRSPGSEVVQLSRIFFPDLCRQNRIPLLPGMDWRPLAGAINKWRRDYGMNVGFIRQMMEEFVQHPQWCQKSRRLPTMVFISRREDLVGIIAARQRRHPGDRRYHVGEEQAAYLTTGRQRHTEGAEYWLGRS